MGRVGPGIEARESSIRMHFVYNGVARKETLKTDGKPMPPTPANLKYAARLSAEIKEKIRHGSFVYADYFPASASATTGQGVTVADRLDVWLGQQSRKAFSTRKGYTTAVNWWKAKIGAKPIRTLVHSDIVTALTSEADWSGKTFNNKASVLRLALKLSIRDGIIKANPIDGLESASHQSPDPDPFAKAEADAIIAAMTKQDEQIGRYFAFKFYTGVRTSESLALRWENVDWKRKTITVRDAIVLGEYNRRTKTSTVRHVELNSVALAVLKAQKAATFLKPHGWIFPDPRTGERFTDDEPPRELWWRPTLKRLGIRYRSPYETRHTYATMMLMGGVTPAFAARQMGHSVQMFLDTYSKWIDGGQNAVEMAKLETLLSSRQTPRASGESR
jgi:integrase